MYQEQVARRILFDFEVISLLALMIGMLAYAYMGSFKKRPAEGIGSRFEQQDLLLVFFPLIFFLINPIFAHLIPTSGEADLPKAPKTISDQAFGIVMNIVSFLFTGLITFVILQWIMMRDVVTLFGLRKLRAGQIISFAIGGTIISFLVCSVFLGGFSSEYLAEKFGTLEAQRAVAEMKGAKSPLVIFLSVIAAVIIAPVVEEFLFRGYFYGVIKRFSSRTFAALITSALFAVVHLNLPALLPLWLFAIILVIAYELTRCLWVPIAIHAMFNGLNIILLFFEKASSGSASG